MAATLDQTPSPFRIVCLCAEWCGVCREWRAAFEEQARAHPSLHFAWVDVEDEAEAMGEVDIETFPTLLVARADEVLFLGPVPPSGAGLARLLASLQSRPAAASGLEAAATPLLRRLQQDVLRRTRV